jgi:arylsulfatase A-like enzyme
MTSNRKTHRSRPALLGLALAAGLALLALAVLPWPTGPEASAEAAKRAEPAPPNVLLITIDTLRADRLSAYGYRRPTSPNLDRLMAGGARLEQARTVEPLTNPALSSMITSLYPHEHGGTRNGLRMRTGLDSLPKQLGRRGYNTAAFVGNWTLKNRLSGLGEHFDSFNEVLTKRRWYGLFKGEADADDVSAAALEWLATNGGRRRPFFLWVHYVDPHAPYVHHEEFDRRLGLSGNLSKSDRYDTEVAFVDHHVGRLLDAVNADPDMKRRTLVVFTSDHGESLGEHDYWGHGRNLYEPNLRIPFGMAWAGKIRPQVLREPALLIDVAPTVLGFLGVDRPKAFRGHDWSDAMAGGPRPTDRTTWFQAHRGAVLTAEDAKDARTHGLLEVGVLLGGVKEVLEVEDERARAYDLRRDPGERKSLAEKPSDTLMAWHQQVEEGLEKAGRYPPPTLDEEDVETLKSLGYTN